MKEMKWNSSRQRPCSTKKYIRQGLKENYSMRETRRLY